MFSICEQITHKNSLETTTKCVMTYYKIINIQFIMKLTYQTNTIYFIMFYNLF